MKRISLALVLTAVALAAPAHAQEEEAIVEQAQEQTALEMRAEQVVAVVNGEIEPNEVFTAGFLAAVPPAQLAALSQQITQQFGPALAVESLDPPGSTRAALAIRMERAIARGGLAIDTSDDNRISELLFQTFEPLGDTPKKIEADLAALPGDVSWWFGPLDGSAPTMASETDGQMAVGSTFKLYVLATLAREVAQGERNWADVVELESPRSFPSGMMQDWPRTTPVTLHTLASLMISVSDNTATDALMKELGSEAVYQTLVESGHSQPELNNPLMTTRELFLLKGGPSDRLAVYQSGDGDVRKQILDQIEDIDVSASQIEAAFSSGPIAIDVEWFASAGDLANLFRFMRETADPVAFEIMGINKSMPETTAEKWAYAGFKGGSEPGVLNLSWLLTDSEGNDHALVLSWNNPSANLDSTTLELIGQRMLSLPQ